MSLMSVIGVSNSVPRSSWRRYSAGMSSAPHPKCQMVDRISDGGAAFTLVNNSQDFCAQMLSNAPANFWLTIETLRIEFQRRFWVHGIQVQMVEVNQRLGSAGLRGDGYGKNRKTRRSEDPSQHRCDYSTAACTTL